jgi:hypothetical protein
MSEDYSYSHVRGGCLCDAVRYDAEVALEAASYCHCRTCQKTSGAPAEIAVFVRPGTLKFTKDDPKYFQSSPFGRRGFCETCGSRLIWMSPDKPRWTNLSVGTLDHPERVVPIEHCCVESQLPWYEVADELPRKLCEEDADLIEAWTAAGLTHDGKPR